MSDLGRFVSAQEGVYEVALDELRRGRKESHWMWFVFPQVEGLGSSEMARRYAIRDRAEARAYLAHPVLGPRLRECGEVLLRVTGRSAYEVMGSPDDLKLCSSMTLFAEIEVDSVFSRILEKYFGGIRDVRTLEELDGKPNSG